jgi:[ribosomal protein S5]-alanine N-acetyltransferase
MPVLVTPAVPVGSLAARPQPTLTADGSVLLRPWGPDDAPAARGKGVAPRAVDAMASWAFEAGFYRLALAHSTVNTASCRVAEKAGFAAEGVRRGAWLLADGRHDAHSHARLRP